MSGWDAHLQGVGYSVDEIAQLRNDADLAIRDLNAAVHRLTVGKGLRAADPDQLVQVWARARTVADAALQESEYRVLLANVDRAGREWGK